ncbi:hypothetical protein T265_04174 [Opisthorchis viverrini]|uniref:Uncharacterized protein n=1 Tax=Opisthorchis viverrini TaxID=6198 RepID=A0A074ZQ24_OPIVI|nr:hypothetical protein T265_04174 [Opisthorchis viverrini]KER29171.1 hypothetical protein T265_04174 [Opisthorchis viverrini]
MVQRRLLVEWEGAVGRTSADKELCGQMILLGGSTTMSDELTVTVNRLETGVYGFQVQALQLPPPMEEAGIHAFVNMKIVIRRLAAMLTEGGTTAGILPCCPSLDKSRWDAEVGFEPKICQSQSWLKMWTCWSPAFTLPSQRRPQLYLQAAVVSSSLPCGIFRLEPATVNIDHPGKEHLAYQE